MSPRGRTRPVLTVAFAVVGAVTALPVLALVDADVLRWTYAVRDPDPMTLALLQHRGVLQLALGAGLVWAALFPPARIAVVLAALVTKSSFLALVLRPGLRADVAPFSIVFDAVCIAAFAVYLAVVAGPWRPGVRDRRPSPSR